MQTVIETPTFIADCRNAGLTDDEVMEVKIAIAADPRLGDVMAGTGGALKRRFPRRGKGKSGGYRTVTFFAGDDLPVVLLALIDKGERANISRAQHNILRTELQGYADDYRASVSRRVVELRKKGRAK
jgi:hypothetical protein